MHAATNFGKSLPMKKGPFPALNTLLPLLALLHYSCTKQDNIVQSNKKPTGLVAEFARKHLPQQVFDSYNWAEIKTIRHADTIVGWVINTTGIFNDNFTALQVIAANGKPAEIIRHHFDSASVLLTGKGNTNYEKQYFLHPRKIETAINVGQRPNENTPNGRQVNRLSLSSECECCQGTLPCVIVYGQRREKKKVLMVNTGIFNPGSYPEPVYVPLADIPEGGGGGTGNGEPGGNGSTGDDSLETLYLENFSDWVIYKGTYL